MNGVWIVGCCYKNSNVYVFINCGDEWEKLFFLCVIRYDGGVFGVYFIYGSFNRL